MKLLSYATLAVTLACVLKNSYVLIISLGSLAKLLKIESDQAVVMENFQSIQKRFKVTADDDYETKIVELTPEIGSLSQRIRDFSKATKPVVIHTCLQEFMEGFLAVLASYGVWKQSKGSLRLLFGIIFFEIVLVVGFLKYCSTMTDVTLLEFYHGFGFNCTNPTLFHILETALLQTMVFVKNLIDIDGEWSGLADVANIILWASLVYIYATIQPLTKKEPKRKCSMRKPLIGSGELLLDSKWLWHACFYGHKNLVRKIVDKYANEIDINEKKLMGFSALHLAVVGNHLPVVQILLSRFKTQINYNLRSGDGLNPLDMAIQQNSPPITRVLLRYGKPDISSLILAVEHNQPGVVEILHRKLKKLYASKVDVVVPIERYLELQGSWDPEASKEEGKKLSTTTWRCTRGTL